MGRLEVGCRGNTPARQRCAGSPSGPGGMPARAAASSWCCRPPLPLLLTSIKLTGDATSAPSWLGRTPAAVANR